MNLSKEAQKKLDDITPKMTFVNCLALVNRMSMSFTNWDYFRQKVNQMSQPEQQKLAEEWEAQGFTKSQQFVDYLTNQPYFRPTADEVAAKFAEFVEKTGGYYNVKPSGEIEATFELADGQTVKINLNRNRENE